MRRELCAGAFAVMVGFGGSASAESPEAKALKKACDAGGMGECLRLAYLYAEGKDADPKKAAATFKKVCDAGKLAACVELAQMYEDGVGVKQDQKIALALRQKVCDAGDGEVCYALASDDPAHGAAHFEKACSAGHADGCYNGGLSYSRGSQGATRDMARATALYQKGCDAGSLPACYNAGVALMKGDAGLPKDAARAAALFTKACEAKTTQKPGAGFEEVQPTACYNLAVLHQRGEGVKSNMARARQLFEIACKAKVTEACPAADSAKTLEKHPEDAAAGARGGIAVYMMKSCDDGQAVACRQLGEFALTGTDFFPKNPTRAPEYFKRANTLNTAHCDKGGKGASMACMELSRAYEGGQGVAKDAARAAALVKKANGVSQAECDKGSFDECATLGANYQWGIGLPKDLARAAALFKKACDGGSQSGCLQAKELVKKP
jgi:TPR repeat protein